MKLTNNGIPLEVLEALDLSFFAEKNKIIKTLNEVYQYNKECFRKTNRGDLSFLKNLLEKYEYIIKFN